jgi:opacity protein-like surface antigen
VKKLLLAAALTVAATSAANAVSITVGWWDSVVGGGVTPIYSQNSGNLFTLNGQWFARRSRVVQQFEYLLQIILPPNVSDDAPVNPSDVLDVLLKYSDEVRGVIIRQQISSGK